MTAKRSGRPAHGFKTLDEEVEYWGRHGSDDDVLEDERVEFVIAPGARSRMISIRIPGDLLDGIRAVARVRHERYQTLIKQWLAEALHRQARQAASRASEGVSPYGTSSPADRERDAKARAGAVFRRAA
jgi:hypothetical protein